MAMTIYTAIQLDHFNSSLYEPHPNWQQFGETVIKENSVVRPLEYFRESGVSSASIMIYEPIATTRDWVITDNKYGIFEPTRKYIFNLEKYRSYVPYDIHNGGRSNYKYVDGFPIAHYSCVVMYTVGQEPMAPIEAGNVAALIGFSVVRWG